MVFVVHMFYILKIYVFQIVLYLRFSMLWSVYSFILFQCSSSSECSQVSAVHMFCVQGLSCSSVLSIRFSIALKTFDFVVFSTTAFLAIVSVFIYGMVFCPVFTCLAMGSVFGYGLGALYVWMLTGVQIYKLTECQSSAVGHVLAPLSPREASKKSFNTLFGFFFFVFFL